MKLSEEKFKRFQDNLKTQNVDLKCPICGNNHFSIESVEYQLPSYNTDGHNIRTLSQFEYIPIIMLICKKCHYLMPFAAL